MPPQNKTSNYQRLFVIFTAVFSNMINQTHIPLASDHLISLYKQRISFFNEEINKEKKGVNVIFYTRLLVFITSFLLFFLFIQQSPGIAFLLLLFVIILFLVLLKKELKAQRRIDYLKKRIQLNENEILILNNNFNTFDPGKEFINKEHPYISDLDIFGHRSVFQLLNRTSTYSGRVKLANWLTFPFLNTGDIIERQQAIKCLSTKLEWSQQLIAQGVTDKENEQDKDIIRDWLNEDVYFSSSFIRISRIVLPILTVASLLLFFAGIVDSGYFIFLFFFQLFVVGSKLKVTNHIHNQLSRKINSVEKYASLIHLIEGENFDGELLNNLKQQLSAAQINAGNIIRKLKKLVDLLDSRLNILVAVVLNGIFLFDIQIMYLLEKWKTDNKDHFLNWIDIIGEFDAFTSLGIYAYNNPSYVYPETETGSFMIHAEGTGHPLILKTKLVKNSYKLAGLSRIDLLTGANMAGKSTFLRTIGVNLILAMIGTPVCAQRFRFTPVLLFTSLRTNDSLQENESFFYAELKRLQQLMQQYEEGKQVFFLLDEILKGTNSKDQHIGSMELIKKIIRLKGSGIVATHDIELSKLQQEFPEHIRNLCFEIRIENDKLSFDYTIKEGVCATMNASFLMKKMGIT